MLACQYVGASHKKKKTGTDIKNLVRTKFRYCSVVSESVVICQLTLKMAEEIDYLKK